MHEGTNGGEVTVEAVAPQVEVPLHPPVPAPERLPPRPFRFVAFGWIVFRKAVRWNWNLAKVWLYIQWMRWLMRLSLMALVGLVAVVLAMSLFAIVRTDDNPASKGAGLQAAVAAAGGVIALGTFFLNYWGRLKIADRDRKESEFLHMLDEFSDDNPRARSAAASQLAGMAELRSPGDPLLYTPEFFPWYRRAAEQLSKALYFEQDIAVRGDVIRALERMAKFGSLGSQSLLMLLIAELSDANRQGYQIFMDALGEFMAATDDDPEGRELLGSVVRFHSIIPVEENPKMNRESAVAIALSATGLTATQRHQRLRSAQGRRGNVRLDRSPSARDDWSRILDRLERTAEALVQLRDGLVSALSFRRAECGPLPSLENCFLRGADLCFLRLQEAVMNHVDLASAELQYSKLDWAKLLDSDLSGANLTGSSLLGANLIRANLSGAQLWNVRVADGQSQAIFEDTNWKNADFSGLYVAENMAIQQWLKDNYDYD